MGKEPRIGVCVILTKKAGGRQVTQLHEVTRLHVVMSLHKPTNGVFFLVEEACFLSSCAFLTNTAGAHIY